MFEFRYQYKNQELAIGKLYRIELILSQMRIKIDTFYSSPRKEMEEKFGTLSCAFANDTESALYQCEMYATRAIWYALRERPDTDKVEHWIACALKQNTLKLKQKQYVPSV